MIIPAIDLIDGQVVRLYQGDYNKTTQYQKSPVAHLIDYVAQGATYLHLVDLDGAKNPKHRQLDSIGKIVKAIDCPVQVGGGIRKFDDVKTLIQMGVAKVVIGSLAVSDRQTVKAWFDEFGADKIVLALDVNIVNQIPKVATHGWQQHSDISIYELIDDYQSVGLRHILCTDISKDGTLLGSNTALYNSLCQRYPKLKVQASGGIGSLQDIASLKNTGVAGVIVGRALLENKFDVKGAIQCWQNA